MMLRVNALKDLPLINNGTIVMFLELTSGILKESYS